MRRHTWWIVCVVTAPLSLTGCAGLTMPGGLTSLTVASNSSVDTSSPLSSAASGDDATKASTAKNFTPVKPQDKVAEKSAPAARKGSTPLSQNANGPERVHPPFPAFESTIEKSSSATTSTDAAKRSAEKKTLPSPTENAVVSQPDKKSGDDELRAIAERVAKAEGPHSQDAVELRRAIESSGDSLPPLLRQQLLGMLEFSQPRPEPSSTLGSTPAANSSANRVIELAATNSQRSEKSPAEFPVNSDQPSSSRKPETTKDATTITAPHVTVNVTTAAPERLEAPPLEPDSRPVVQGSSRRAKDASREVTLGPGHEPPRLLSAHVSPEARKTVASIDQVATASHTAAVPNAGNSWRDSVSDAIATLEDELKIEQADMRPDERTRIAARLRLLYAVADRREDAVRAIDGLPKPQQEFWKNQTHGLLVAMNSEGIPDEHRRSAVMLRHLRTATEHLAAASTLDLRNLTFCTRVDSFGTYTEFPRYEFKADDELLLYVEVDNFAAEEKTNNHKSREFETEFRGNYQILDVTGRRVIDVELPTDRQTCRNRRRDYFIAYRIYLPKKIEPGAYTLQLAIEDVKGAKFGQGSLELKIKN